MNRAVVRRVDEGRQARIASLRAQMEALGAGAVGAPAVGASALAVAPTGAGAVGAGAAGGIGKELVEIPGPLGRLLGGGLVRRRVTEVSDCPALVAEVIARVSAAGGQVAIVGWVELALAQVAEEGELSRVVSIPAPGAAPWAITSVLLEGMDLVIHHGPAVEISPRLARPVLAKLRAGRAALVTVGPHLPGAWLQVHGEVTTYRGIGRGTGRIRGLDIAVSVRGKAGPARVGTVTVGQARRLASA